MNPRRSFLRKIVYLVAIAVLLVPLYWLGQPTTGTVEEIDGVRQVVSGKPGGKLAQLRTKYGLSEAQLGDLDPVGETMQLATFGLRGVATVVLWEKATTTRRRRTGPTSPPRSTRSPSWSPTSSPSGSTRRGTSPTTSRPNSTTTASATTG